MNTEQHRGRSRRLKGRVPPSSARRAAQLSLVVGVAAWIMYGWGDGFPDWLNLVLIFGLPLLGTALAGYSLFARSSRRWFACLGFVINGVCLLLLIIIVVLLVIEG